MANECDYWVHYRIGEKFAVEPRGSLGLIIDIPQKNKGIIAKIAKRTGVNGLSFAREERDIFIQGDSERLFLRGRNKNDLYQYLSEIWLPVENNRINVK